MAQPPVTAKDDKTSFWKFISAVAAAAAIIFGFMNSQTAQTSAGLQTKLDELGQQLTAATKQSDEGKAQIGDLTTKLTEATKQLTEVAAGRNQAQSSIVGRENELVAMRSVRDFFKSELGSTKAALTSTVSERDSLRSQMSQWASGVPNGAGAARQLTELGNKLVASQGIRDYFKSQIDAATQKLTELSTERDHLRSVVDQLQSDGRSTPASAEPSVEISNRITALSGQRDHFRTLLEKASTDLQATNAAYNDLSSDLTGANYEIARTSSLPDQLAGARGLLSASMAERDLLKDQVGDLILERDNKTGALLGRLSAVGAERDTLKIQAEKFAKEVMELMAKASPAPSPSQ